MSSETQEKRNTNDPVIVSVIAYIAFIGLVIAFVLNRPQQELASFHIRQALGIYLLFTVSSFVMIVPIIGWIAGMVGILLGVVLWIIGIIDAINKRQCPVAVLGPYFQRWFQAL